MARYILQDRDREERLSRLPSEKERTLATFGSNNFIGAKFTVTETTLSLKFPTKLQF